jgi:DNA-binding transcriptional MerR regulator
LTKIKEAAERCGLSVDTVRFYEKAGMLPRIPRDKSGWRRFDADAGEWLVTLGQLRSTGMPLKDVRRFAVLVHEDSAPSNGPLILAYGSLTRRRLMAPATRRRCSARR